MEGVFCLRLLGPVQVERDGEPVRGLQSRKVLALLAYLITQGQPVSREYLADLFWGDKSEARGRANLSWTLNRISGQLPGCLQADHHTIQFQRAASYWLDLDAFAELAAQGEPAALAEAVELYRGEFLEGLCLAGCAEFEIWLVKEREHWRQQVARVLGALVTHHRQRGEYEQGLRFAQRLLILESWREEAHRQVMRLLAYTGQRSAALAQYEICCWVLAEELAVEPAAETTRLYEQIRDGELEVPVAPPVHLPDLPVQPPSFLLAEGEAAAHHPALDRPVFVARERELEQLDGFLGQMLAGQGQVVFVTGEAGQGKTALIQEFTRRAQVAHPDPSTRSGQALVVASGNGNAHTGIGDPYLPFREILGLLTGDVEARWAAGAMSQDQACRLWHILPLVAPALVEVGPDLIDRFVSGTALVKRAVASAPVGADWLPRLRELVARKASLPPDPSLQQSALFEQYSRVLQALAHQRPLLLWLDDLQWADAGSVSLLFHLGRRIEGSPILIVGAYRPEEVALGRFTSPSRVGGIEGGRERHPLEPVINEFKRHFGDIEVNLGQAEGREFVDAFVDTEPNRLDNAFRETLYRQTRGHPLFTVELLRGMQERGDLVKNGEERWVEGPTLDWETLPARVEAVIAERIARLPEQLQDTLTVASVEGETFTAEVVARVRATDEQEMVGRLSGKLDRQHRLVREQGMQRLEAGPLSCYRFRHILFQKYLYNGLGEAERAYLHRAVGAALEALYRERTEEIAAGAVQLARHFQEAGIVEKAVAYLHQAGERALRMSAHEEAITHFSRGLELLETLPDSGGEHHRLERAQQELALQIGLGVSLQTIRGYAAPETGRAYARARELCRQMGETPQIFPVLWLLALFYAVQGRFQTTHEIAEQLLNLAEQAGDPLLVAVAHLMRGWNLFFLGKPTQARTHLEHTITFYDPQKHHTLAFLYGLDPGVVSLSAMSWALWALGYPKQARQRSCEALALAQELTHSPSLIMTHTYAGLLCTFCRDWQKAQALAEACIRLATEHGSPYWLSGGLFCHGWALAKQGQAEEGVAQMREGIAGNRATGADALVVVQLATLAEACGKAGQPEEGLATVAEALATVDRTSERFYEAEVYRIKGELLLKDEGRRRRDESPEDCFHQAIEVARQQQAKSWELRAVMSLCRLWQEQGRRAEARERLAEVYGWFSEGFDTPDLQEARVLLEVLS